ncbi:hypothetical protein J2S53_003131 [Actinopolyspora lacussalsi]|nr:hypothetical protein [Actinopolyspora lacussalsi]
MGNARTTAASDLAELRQLASTILDRVTDLSDRVAVLERRLPADRREDGPQAPAHEN